MDIAATSIAVISALAAVFSAFAAIKSNADAKAPHVVAYLDSERDSAVLEFCVQNIGRGVAYHISMEGEPPFGRNVKSHVEGSFIFSEIPMLIPGAIRRTVIGGRVEFSDDGKKTYPVTVTYYKGNKKRVGNRVKESFELDYFSFLHTLYVNSNAYETKSALEDISEATKRIADTLGGR